MAKKDEKKGGKKKDSCECGEQYESDKVGAALIDGETFYSKEVQYTEVDGFAMFEGDIVLGTVEEVERSTELRRAEIRGEISAGVVVLPSRRWPNCIIPYTIDSGLPNQSRVTDAIAHWEANTRVRFVLRTAANQAMYPDYVEFRPGAGCRANVGRVGGYQFVELGAGCTTGNTIHEIGHTVGLWHEQSREDRNAFVTINWANIIPGREGNFTQHVADGDDVGAYDYGSIMHYPRNAFSIDRANLDTIVPTNPAAVIGQRNGLSAGDIAAANSLCPAPICPPGPIIACPPAPRIACPPAPRRLCPPAPRVACPPAPRIACPPAPRRACPPAPRVACPPAPRVACPPAPRIACPPAPRRVCPPAPRITCPPAPRRVCPPAPRMLTCPPSPRRVMCPPAPRGGCWAGPYMRPGRFGRVVNPARIRYRDADYDYYEDYDYEDGYGYEDSYGGEEYYDYEGGCGCGCGCDCCEGGEGYGYGEDYGSQDPYADWTDTEYADPYEDCGCDGGEDQGGFDPGCEG